MEPAKEEATRAFMAIVKEAEEGMQKGKEWQAGLKVYKEERAGKGSSHEAQSRSAGREPAGQPLGVQQAAPARFSCQTAWASRTPPDIAAWYFSPEAPDIYSHFKSGWAPLLQADFVPIWSPVPFLLIQYFPPKCLLKNWLIYAKTIKFQKYI